VKDEQVFYKVKEERNILLKIKLRNCFRKHVIKGKKAEKIEFRGGNGRRRKQLLDDLKGKRGYCKLDEGALDSTLWRTGFGRGYGLFVRLTTGWMNE
jgi:hypothetical protein